MYMIAPRANGTSALTAGFDQLDRLTRYIQFLEQKSLTV
jgi:hypothetical protein